MHKDYLVTVGRGNQTIVTSFRRRAVPLIVLHQGQIKFQPHLVYEVPVKAGNQLRVAVITNLQTVSIYTRLSVETLNFIIQEISYKSPLVP